MKMKRGKNKKEKGPTEIKNDQNEPQLKKENKTWCKKQMNWKIKKLLKLKKELQPVKMVKKKKKTI